MQLSALEVLDLSHNSIYGSLPDAFSGYGSRLAVVDVSRNLLTGTLPASWRNLKSLRSLNMSYNTLGNDNLSIQVPFAFARAAAHVVSVGNAHQDCTTWA
jgi:hypothetical protein